MSWPTTQLGDVALDIRQGFAMQPCAEGEGIPQVRTNNVTVDGRIDLSATKHVNASSRQAATYALHSGDVVFNNTNSPALVGKTAVFVANEPHVFSNHMTRIRVDTRRADPGYIARFLHHTWADGGFKHLTTQWVSQAAIGRNELARLVVPLPPLDIQRRIADLLDEADRLRRLRAEADAKAERILPALFIKMFGDPATWSVGRNAAALGDIVDMTGGMTPSKSVPEYWNGVAPWVTPKDMKGDTIRDSADHVSAIALKSTDLRIIRPPAVLVVVRGMILARDVPVATVVTDATINQDMKALTPKDSRVNCEHVFASLRVSKQQLLERVGQSAHGTRKLDADILMRLPIPLPSPKQLIATGTAVRALREQAELHAVWARATAETSAALSATCFSPAWD